MVQLKTREGHALRLTGEHRIRKISRLTRYSLETEWTQASALQPGDQLLLQNHRDLSAWDGAGDFGEGYVLGLLMAEAMLVPEGASCLSLGTRTPLADIRSAAVSGGFDIVGLSFSIAYPARQAIEGLLELRALLPEEIALWAGGAAVRDKQKRLPGIHVVGDLEDTMAALLQWRRTHA